MVTSDLLRADCEINTRDVTTGGAIIGPRACHVKSSLPLDRYVASRLLSFSYQMAATDRQPAHSAMSSSSSTSSSMSERRPKTLTMHKHLAPDDKFLVYRPPR